MEKAEHCVKVPVAAAELTTQRTEQAMRLSHKVLFAIWGLILLGLSLTVVSEVTQRRLPDAVLISSYIGFAGICLIISFRRIFRRPAYATEKGSLVMRVLLLLLYFTWFSAAVSLYFVAEREGDQFGKHENAMVLRVVSGLMVAVGCLAPLRLRFKHADRWDYRTDAEPIAASQSMNWEPFKLGCGLILVPLVTIVVVFLIMITLWLG